MTDEGLEEVPEYESTNCSLHTTRRYPLEHRELSFLTLHATDFRVVDADLQSGNKLHAAAVTGASRHMLFLYCYFYSRSCISFRMAQSLHSKLSRRERQIMDILYRRGRATANDVMAELTGEPNYSTVRTQLRVLEEKGHVQHETEGNRFVYTPTVPRHAVRQPALKHLVETFFGGSPEKVLAALIGNEGARLSDEELDRLAQLIDKARKGGRK
jgi:predicted transcriptional regulator